MSINFLNKSPRLISLYIREREREIRIYYREICTVNSTRGNQGSPAPAIPLAGSDQRDGEREKYEPFTGVLSTSSRACASAVDASGGRDVSMIEAESGRGSDGGSESGMGGSREGEEDER